MVPPETKHKYKAESGFHGKEELECSPDSTPGAQLHTVCLRLKSQHQEVPPSNPRLTTWPPIPAGF